VIYFILGYIVLPIFLGGLLFSLWKLRSLKAKVDDMDNNIEGRRLRENAEESIYLFRSVAWVTGVLLLLISGFVFVMSVRTVDPNTVAIPIKMGQPGKQIGPGFHWVGIGTTKTIEYPLDLQSISFGDNNSAECKKGETSCKPETASDNALEIRASTKNGENGVESVSNPFYIDAQVNFALKKGDIRCVYMSYLSMDSLKKKLLEPTFRDVAVQVYAQKTIYEVISGAQTPEIKEEIINKLSSVVNSKLADAGNARESGACSKEPISIRSIDIKRPTLSLALDKQLAESNAIAERIRQSDAKVREANSLKEINKAEAEANRVKSEGLTPEILELQKLEILKSAKNLTVVVASDGAVTPVVPVGTSGG